MRQRWTRSLVIGALLLPAIMAGVADAACGAPPSNPPLTFDDPAVIDDTRAGGEPSIEGLPDGSLVYSSHAGNTHLYKRHMPDPDFVTPHTGADFVWRSDDQGTTWEYVGLDVLGDRGPHAVGAVGFSDPTTAVDAAGNVYVAGIDVANVYVAKSSDSGRTWSANPLAAVMTDREWLAADEENVVYLNGKMLGYGNSLWKSKDGGASWTVVPHRLEAGGPPSPIAVDKRDGRLYYPYGGQQGRGGVGFVSIYPGIRQDDFTHEEVYFLEGGLQHHGGFLNPITLDAAGNVYIVSNSSRGVWVHYSTDRGATWTRTNVHVAPGSAREVIWPWITAGDDGRVGVAWLQAYQPELLEPARWHVMAAQSSTAHGWTDACGEKRPPIWNVAVATPEPIHFGEICARGLACNGDVGYASDRRLGDYITASISAEGKLLIAYGNTAAEPNGAIAHPGFVRQATGIDFREG